MSVPALATALPTDDPLDDGAAEGFPTQSSDESDSDDSDEADADAAIIGAGKGDELLDVMDPKPPDQPEKETVTAAPARLPSTLPPPRELYNFAAARQMTIGGADGSSTTEPAPPRMRTGYAMLYPPPVHLVDEPQAPEPLVRNKKLDELVASLMAADAERLQNPMLSLNRVAYDAFDPIDLKSNLFVRDDCLNQVLPAIDAPLGEAPPMPNAQTMAAATETAAAPAGGSSSGGGSSGSGGNYQQPSGTGGPGGSGSGSPRSAAAAAQQPPLPPSKRPPAARLAAPPSRDCLAFESRFESGNLRRAVQVSPFEYDLILRPDLNTRGHTQWFYFAFANAQRGCTYKFNILNCVKPDSLFNFGNGRGLGSI